MARKFVTDVPRVRQFLEGAGGMDDVAADHREHRFDVADLLLGNRQVVGREDREISALAGPARAALGGPADGRPRVFFDDIRSRAESMS